MTDPHLYLFECGTLHTKAHLITLNQGWQEDLVLPVPWYVVSHPRGNVSD